MIRQAGVGAAGVIAAAAAALLALAACTAPAAAPARGEGPTALRPLIPITHPQVTNYCTNADAEHLDGDATSVDRLYVCTARELQADEESYPGTRQQVFRVRDFAALLEAYSQPDASRRDACGDAIVDPLIVWIWRGDRITPIYAPVDDCGVPQDKAADAYADLDLHKVLEAREKREL